MRIEYNVGDKVICKKSFRPNGEKHFKFLKNNSYQLIELGYWDTEHNVMFYNIDGYRFFVFDDTIDKTNPFSNIIVKFETFFYTKKELRQLKIKKLIKKQK